MFGTWLEDELTIFISMTLSFQAWQSKVLVLTRDVSKYSIWLISWAWKWFAIKSKFKVVVFSKSCFLLDSGRQVKNGLNMLKISNIPPCIVVGFDMIHLSLWCNGILGMNLYTLYIEIYMSNQ